jgi:adenylate kinase family enzyme
MAEKEQQQENSDPGKQLIVEGVCGRRNEKGPRMRKWHEAPECYGATTTDDREENYHQYQRMEQERTATAGRSRKMQRDILEVSRTRFHEASSQDVQRIAEN